MSVTVDQPKLDVDEFKSWLVIYVLRRGSAPFRVVFEAWLTEITRAQPACTASRKPKVKVIHNLVPEQRRDDTWEVRLHLKRHGRHDNGRDRGWDAITWTFGVDAWGPIYDAYYSHDPIMPTVHA